MKARDFNNIMPLVHEKRMAHHLQMQVNLSAGPDLLADDKIAEVKFTLCKDKYPLSWTVFDYQMKYPEQHQKSAYWILGIYTLNKDINNIRRVRPYLLEKMVQERQVYIIHWDWMQRYSPSKTQGTSKTGSWENTFRYPKLRDVPPITKTYTLPKGKIHITQGVSLDAFEVVLL